MPDTVSTKDCSACGGSGLCSGCQAAGGRCHDSGAAKCEACKGTGIAGGKAEPTTPTCPVCGGSKRVAIQPSSGTAGLTEPCTACATPTCPNCQGPTKPYGEFVTREWECAAEQPCGAFTMMALPALTQDEARHRAVSWERTSRSHQERADAAERAHQELIDAINFYDEDVDSHEDAVAQITSIGPDYAKASADRDSWAKLMVEVRESAEDALHSANPAKWKAILESIDARITVEIHRLDKAGAVAALVKDAKVLATAAEMSGRCAGTHAVPMAECQHCDELLAALTRHGPSKGRSWTGECKPDPAFQREQGNSVHPHINGTWGFFDETWGSCLQPFDTQDEATEACKRYAESL